MIKAAENFLRTIKQWLYEFFKGLSLAFSAWLNKRAQKKQVELQLKQALACATPEFYNLLKRPLLGVLAYVSKPASIRKDDSIALQKILLIAQENPVVANIFLSFPEDQLSIENQIIFLLYKALLTFLTLNRKEKNLSQIEQAKNFLIHANSLKKQHRIIPEPQSRLQIMRDEVYWSLGNACTNKAINLNYELDTYSRLYLLLEADVCYLYISQNSVHYQESQNNLEHGRDKNLFELANLWKKRALNYPITSEDHRILLKNAIEFYVQVSKKSPDYEDIQYEAAVIYWLSLDNPIQALNIIRRFISKGSEKIIKLYYTLTQSVQKQIEEQKEVKELKISFATVGDLNDWYHHQEDLFEKVSSAFTALGETLEIDDIDLSTWEYSIQKEKDFMTQESPLKQEVRGLFERLEETLKDRALQKEGHTAAERSKQLETLKLFTASAMDDIELEVCCSRLIAQNKLFTPPSGGVIFLQKLEDILKKHQLGTSLTHISASSSKVSYLDFITPEENEKKTESGEKRKSLEIAGVDRPEEIKTCLSRGDSIKEKFSPVLESKEREEKHTPKIAELEKAIREKNVQINKLDDQLRLLTNKEDDSLLKVDEKAQHWGM